MGKEILRQLSDDDFDHDGYEEEDNEYQEMLEDWRFEMSTLNY